MELLPDSAGHVSASGLAEVAGSVSAEVAGCVSASGLAVSVPAGRSVSAEVAGSVPAGRSVSAEVAGCVPAALAGPLPGLRFEAAVLRRSGAAQDNGEPLIELTGSPRLTVLHSYARAG